MPDIRNQATQAENPEITNQSQPTQEQVADVGVEQQTEQETMPEVTEVKKIEQQTEAVPPTTQATTPATPVVPAKSLVYEEIEDILEEDIEDIYFEMPPEKQTEFRQTGEETTIKIEGLLSEVKVKVKKILGLIKNWLGIVPGINKFFLEQEAKIKTDKILEIKDKQPQQTDQPQEDKNKI